MNIPCYIKNQKDGTDLVLLPGGWFWMGSDDGDSEANDSEKPRHLHHVSPFYLALACVTVRQFGLFVTETGYAGGDYQGTGNMFSERWGKWREDPADHPVRYVNWHDATAYAKWAGLRLPTEAEWELGARGYGALKYPWGQDWENGQRVTWDKQKGPGGNTTPVLAHPDGAGVSGMFQQSGNLWEWCEDWYDEAAYQRYATEDFMSPESGRGRVFRGGSWYVDDPGYFRGADRNDYNPEYRDDDFGFRLARTVTL